jgi:two-component system sensor histidine kinase ChvG
MNLKRQLLLVSLLTLVLPWAGCQFIGETESALRTGQQQMLAGTARAIADSLAQYEDEFPLATQDDHVVGDSLYGHRIDSRPNIDGYFDDWNLSRDALRGMRGADGPVQFAVGLHEQFVYLYVEVADKNVV